MREVKLALPCSPLRQPISLQGIFHEKAGVIEDKAGNRLAFNGSVNETAQGWTINWESFDEFVSLEVLLMLLYPVALSKSNNGQT